jgi:hydrogenase nickel incorporation protein HypB
MSDKPKLIGSDQGEVFEIELDKNIMGPNLELSLENKEIFEKNNVLAVDIMGSIGSGKTTLLEESVKLLRDKYSVFVLGGDITTTIDVDRIARHNVPTIQINTGRGCHLDANLVRNAMLKIDLAKVDILFIENVGNLICPAGYPLGAELRVAVVSVTEGPYMVKKHPFIFGTAQIVVINKIDLAEVMEVDPEILKADVYKINPDAKVVLTAARHGQGIKEFIQLLGL